MFRRAVRRRPSALQTRCSPDSPAMADPMARLQATIHELGALGVYFVTGGDPETGTSAP